MTAAAPQLFDEEFAAGVTIGAFINPSSYSE